MATVSRVGRPARVAGRRSTIDRVSPPPRGARKLPWLALGAVVLVLGVVAVLLVVRGQGDVSNPDVTFLDTTESTPDTARGHGRARHPADDGFTWPVYGFTKSRTHDLPLRRTPRPPYRQAWAVRGKVLLEFSPVLCRRKVFLLKNNGALYAISRLTGRVSWKRRLGTLAAASPACSHGTVYAALLTHRRNSATGRVVAVSAKTGRLRWSRTMLVAAQLDPDALSLRDANLDGWQKGLSSSAFVITDALTANEMPAGTKTRIFRIIADSSLEELRIVAKGFLDQGVSAATAEAAEV